MDITIRVDVKSAVAQLREDERQIPFALAKAVNATALDVQKAERRQLRRVFTLRRPEWADRSIKIVKFAKKSDPSATIGIHPPGGDSRADILDKFEDQSQKLPRSGTIAIPVTGIGIRRGGTGVIAASQRPRAIADRKDVFILRKKMGAVGEGLILQRIRFGRGKNRRQSNVVLYYLVRRARLNPNLEFVPTARETIKATWPSHMLSEFDHAVRTSR